MPAEDRSFEKHMTLTTRGEPINMPSAGDPSAQRVRVVFGKLGFDAHDVGARFVMKKLVDAGMEVIFVRFDLAKELVNIAVQDDADVIALSVLTGGHLTVAADLAAAMDDAGIDDCLAIIGGVIADSDAPELHRLGIHGVFGPGSDPDAIVEFIRSNVRR